MVTFRVPSPTPSVESDAPIPETLEDDFIPKIPEDDPILKSRGDGVVPKSRKDGPKSRGDGLVPKRKKGGLKSPGDGLIPESLDDGPLPLSSLRCTGGAPRVREPWVLFVGNLHPNVVEKDLVKLFEPFLGKDVNAIGDIVIRSTRGCGVHPTSWAETTESDRCYATVDFAKFAHAKQVLESSRKTGLTLYGAHVVVANNPADMPDLKVLIDGVFGPKTETKPIRRLAEQKTVLVIEDRQRPLVGPSRSPHPKPRYNPVR